MKKKNIGIIIGVLLLAAAAFATMIYTGKTEKTPAQKFKESLMGIWHNVPLSDKTWLRLKSNGRCTYHLLGKNHTCVFSVVDRKIIIALRTEKDISKIFQKQKKNQGFDVRQATKLGMMIHSITIRENIMKAKLKAIAGLRETLSKPISLKKVSDEQIGE